jgi:dienelactone hydrolase
LPRPTDEARRARTRAPRLGIVLLAAIAATATLVIVSPRAPAAEESLRRGRAAIAAASELHWDFAVTPDARRVIVANEYGEPALVVVDPSGRSAPRRVSTPVRFPGRPSISPDGRFVTFQSVDADPGRTELWLADLAHDRTRVLVPAGDGAPAELVDATWSPDGSRVVYARTWREDDGTWRGQLRAVTIGDGQDELLYDDPGHPARAPAFAPDGAHIAFLEDADLWEIGPHGEAPRRIHAAGEARPAPSPGLPDPPVWLPGGEAFAQSFLADGCHRIHVIARADGAVRWRSPACAMRPQVSPDGSHLAYLSLGSSERTLRWRTLPTSAEAEAEAEDQALGFAEGVTYEYAFASPDEVIALAGTRRDPRALWRYRPGVAPERIAAGPASDATLRPETTSIARSTTIASRDGVAIPVEVFPRTCGEGRAPAIVWLHGGPSEDIAPRWYQEPQYLAALGWTVVAVNYRGSTGNGEAFKQLGEDRSGQIGDVLAALTWTAARPDVDPAQIYVLTVSWSTEIAYPAIARSPVPVRGVIDWLGLPHGSSGGASPPALWLSGRRDGVTPARERAVADRRGHGDAITHVILDAGHEFRAGSERRKALSAVERFLVSTSGYRCTRVRR